MHNLQVFLLVGIALISFHFQSTSANECTDGYFEAIGACFLKNSKCPDKSILYNGECHFIRQDNCQPSELWISNKCCTIDCLKACPYENCSYCCNSPASNVAPITNCPNQPVTPYPDISKIISPNQAVTYSPIVPIDEMSPSAIQPCDGQMSSTHSTCTQNCVQNGNQPNCSPTNDYKIVYFIILGPTVNQPCVTNCNLPCSQGGCGSSTNCSPNANTPCGGQSSCTHSTCMLNSAQISNSTICCPQTFPQPSCQNSCCTTPQPPPILPITTAQPPINNTFPTLAPLSTTTTTTTPATPTTITTPIPPLHIYKCPPGTILIGATCQLMHCRRGSIMKDNRCVIIECPEGTVWTGYRCSFMPEPIAQNLTFYNTVITNFNHSKPDIILNNTNNIVVNASISLHDDSSLNNCSNDDDDDGEDCDTIVTTPLPPPIKPTKCCEVLSPRICELRNNRWHCYSRRNRRCGDFCITPIIYLRPPRVQVRPRGVVMPPLQQDCHAYGNCGQFTGGFDCSGCGTADMDRCSYYCYRYSCPSHRCSFYDQQAYCSHNAGSYGCQEDDGCYDDWCQ